ncbi:AAA family ATPase [Candidatus Peregrinibacteria bacterium]|jgi:hypothetical protein|nr:AAA family ATPase [Candidatus Peregrinibacteria bacterium]MBT4055789.1 AAA family ATPase [Candidatus Peregrinibacteria bacterium]
MGSEDQQDGDPKIPPVEQVADPRAIGETPFGNEEVDRVQGLDMESALDDLYDTENGSITAVLGIEKDNIIKTFPKGSAVLEVSYYGDIESSISQLCKIFGGESLPKNWESNGDKSSTQFVFRNKDQAVAAAAKINQNIGNIMSFGIGLGSGGITTSGGVAIKLGPIFDNVRTAIQNPQDGMVSVHSGLGVAENIPMNEEASQITEFKKFDFNAVTEQSIIHSLSLGLMEPLPTKEGVVATVIFPEYEVHRSSAPTMRRIKGLVNVFRNKNTRVTHAGRQMQIAIGGEGTPGEALKTLQKVYSYIKPYGLTVYLDYGEVDISQKKEDGRFELASGLIDIFKISALKPGCFASDRFVAVSGHVRNEELAQAQYTQHHQDVHEIDSIKRILYPDPSDIDGCRVTVGRYTELKAVQDNLEAFQENQTASVIVFKGTGGIGKTKIGRDETMKRAEDLGLSTVYFKQFEKERNNQGFVLKAFMKEIFDENPQFKSTFGDLYLFANGISTPEYEGHIRMLKQNKAHMLKRFHALMQETSVVISLDDLHWVDAYSLDVLVEGWLQYFDENSKQMLVLAGRTGEESIPYRIIAVLKKRCPALLKEFNLQPLDFQEEEKGLKKIDALVRNTLPEEWVGWETATIPVSFLRTIAAKSEGMPLIAEELTLFLTRGDNPKVTYDPAKKEVIAPAGIIDKSIEGKGVSAVVNTILQAKFSRLTDEEERMADYIIATGEISLDLFVVLLEHFGMDPAKVDEVLKSLKDKKIINLQPVVGFSHDLMRAARESHLKEQTGRLAQIAIECHKTLENTSAEIKEVTPAKLFELLLKAYEGLAHIDQEEAIGVRKIIVEKGLAAAQHQKKHHDNDAALATIKKLFEIIMPQEGVVNWSVVPEREGKDGLDKKIPLAEIQYELNKLAAEVHTRNGDHKKALSCIKEMEKLVVAYTEEGGGGEANFLDTREFLRRGILKLIAALSSADKTVILPAKAALSVAIGLAQKEGVQDISVVLAIGELAIFKIRRLAKVSDIETEARKTILAIQKIERSIKASSGSMEQLYDIEALKYNIKRTAAVSIADCIVDQSSKLDREAAYLQRPLLEGETASQARQAIADLAQLKENYNRNQDLIKDPQALATLYEQLAKLHFLVGNQELSETTMEEGLRAIRNLKIVQPLARLKRVKVELSIAKELRKSMKDQKKWDVGELEKTIGLCKQAAVETKRNNPEDIFVAINTLYQVHPTAMYALAKLKQFERSLDDPTVGPEVIADVKEKIESAWAIIAESFNKVRDFVRLASDRPANATVDPEEDKDYLIELPWVGLLLEAAKHPKINLDLELPEGTVSILDIHAIESILHQFRVDTRKIEKDTSLEDERWVDLMERGLQNLEALYGIE